MVWRFLFDIAFSDTKQLLVGCREQLGKKDTGFDSKVSHSFKNSKMKFKKKLLLFESVKNVSFWEIWQKCPIWFPKIFICVGLRQVTFLSEDWKKLSFWSSVLFTISALEMRERKTYRKQAGSNVSGFLNEVSALDWFVQASL